MQLKVLRRVKSENPEIAGTLMTLEQLFYPKMLMNSLLKNLLKVMLNEPEIVQVLLVLFMTKIKNLKKGMLF